MHRVFKFINSKRQELIEFVKELVSVPTLNPPGGNYDRIVRLLDERCKMAGLKTKKAVVETGLRLLIQIKKQERIKSLRGKLNWDGDLEKMRLDQ